MQRESEVNSTFQDDLSKSVSITSVRKETLSPSSSQPALSIYELIRKGEILGGLFAKQEDTTHAQERHSLAHQAQITKTLGEEAFQKYGAYLAAWHKALENCGMSATFADNTEYLSHRIAHKGRNFDARCVRGVTITARNKMIATTPQYRSKNSTKYTYRLHNEGAHYCNLCANLTQGLDALSDPEHTPSNLLAKIGPYALMVNKFPSHIGDSLILPIDHDDLSTRAAQQRDSVGRLILKPSKHQTREALLTVEYILTVMALCDRFALCATRNHVMDGKSETSHDHFKCTPEDLEQNGVRLIAAGGKHSKSYGVTMQMPHTTPFATMMLSSAYPHLLAEKLVRCTQALERNHQVYTLAYCRGSWLITPRKSDAIGEAPFSPPLGAPAGIHVLYGEPDTSACTERLFQLLAVKGEFDWSKYL